MNEIILLVEKSPKKCYIAKAIGFSIFTEAETWQTLQQQVKDAVQCHFDEGHKPQLIRLHCLARYQARINEKDEVKLRVQTLPS